MRVLILGNSSIAQKRMIPALEMIPAIDGIEVASRSSSGTTYADYKTAIEASSAELVYVSLANSDHAYWARRALESGKHVIVDKPAVLNAEDAEALAELSCERGLCLAEATAYAAHPQIQKIAQLFAAAQCRPTRINAMFSFPPLPLDNFRYRRANGGGAIYDLGPYAVSPGRLFFGAEPIDVQCRVLSTGGEDGVPTAFSVMLEYPEGRSLVGNFGFDTAYCNRLSIFGSDLGIDVDRVFTTPENFANELRVSAPTGNSIEPVPAHDCFKLFVMDVMTKIESQDLDGLRADLLADARAIDSLRAAAERD
ncbi:MAG TPA: Gfo/Idh/MocA family oxidoreductase [Myxococcales bacterium]|nr:Gfo/Idh/MocA family oxidoreductase [Myxococcales bacterium]HIM01995.1 Gfo/Idh/MocA family oxidoreductase [Myxococcales bacterium]